MEKAYVITEIGDEGETRLLGVFSSEEKARKAIEILYSIDPDEVDDILKDEDVLTKITEMPFDEYHNVLVHTNRGGYSA